MLQSLTLKNFQRHKKKKIVFSPGVTSIVGPSDRGKSAILRALRWVVLNQPSGASFIRHGSKSSEVTLKLDGVKVVRSKGRSNTYKLNGKTHRSFGVSVPMPVAGALKMSELNFQDQHDAPFWFSNSAAQVSKNLNFVVDLSLIDKVLANVATMLRKERSRIELLKEEIAEGRERLQKFKGLDAMQAKLDVLYHRAEALKMLETEEGFIQKAVSRAQSAKSRLGQPPPSFEALSAKETALSRLLERQVRLQALIQKADSHFKSMKRLKSEYKKAHHTFHQKTKGQSCPLCGHNL